MRSCIVRAACLALALLAGTAKASDLTDFNALVEQAQSHNRVAIGYLRTGNLDLALLEIDRLRDAWSAFEQRFAGKAAIYGYELKRCDGIAAEPVRSEAEFRRLIDGALASLALVPKAIATRDADLLHRVLIELRSFDNLLAFRFG